MITAGASQLQLIKTINKALNVITNSSPASWSRVTDFNHFTKGKLNNGNENYGYEFTMLRA
jgi:hypothetical protein